MRALVTGGCGFVGRHFVRRLLDDGWEVVSVDDLSDGVPMDEWAFQPKEDSTGKFFFYLENVREFFKYERTSALAASTYDLIIHCAAVVGGRLKIDGDPLAVATDLAIDADFFNWCVADRNALPAKVIYFSSSAAYPISMQRQGLVTKLSESFLNFEGSKVGVPDQTYGWSKLSGEFLAQSAAKNYGLDVAIYRPFGGYGEDQSFDYPFPSIIRRALNKENPITVWGSGDQCRDFIHIDDIVEAVLVSSKLMKPGMAINLGTGVPTSFKDLAALAASLVGYKPVVVNDAKKPEGVFFRVAETYLMNQYYTPKVLLADGVKRTLKFMRDNPVDSKLTLV